MYVCNFWSISGSSCSIPYVYTQLGFQVVVLESSLFLGDGFGLSSLGNCGFQVMRYIQCLQGAKGMVVAEFHPISLEIRGDAVFRYVQVGL